MTHLCHQPALSRNAGEGRRSGLVVRSHTAAVGEAVRVSLPLALQGFRNLEGELDGLAGVEARVAMRVVALGERLLADLLRAADAFGDVLAGQFEMHAAGIAAFRQMDCEGAVQFVEDAVEDTRFIASRGGDRVAVHRVDAPYDLAALALHGA